MPTIIQNYGPIYGEVVNGTVQGRPNGSVYVPLSNTISIALTDLSTRVYVNTSDRLVVNKAISFVAESQDLSSNVRSSVYSDAACTTQVGTSRSEAAGIFNGTKSTIGNANGATLTPGDPYYIRFELINNGVAVATSNVLEVVGS